LLHESVTGSLSETGVRWKTSSTDATYRWDQLVKHRIAEDLILLYTSTNQALIIPRSYFEGPNEWEAAKVLIAQHVRAAY
jgi:hypothetical protein